MPRKILLTEDDPFLIDIYTTKLKESGFQVELANNGEEAMRKLSDGQFDLLVLDLVLPHMDGWEVLRKIKSDKALRSLPVLVLSNLGQRQEVEAGLKLGAAKYLIKAHHTP